MNLSQLYYFQKLADLGSFSKTAKELYITQPALSNSIGKLEKELGVILFERGASGVHLTDEGVEFSRHISTALSEIDRAVEAMHSRSGHFGIIRVATTDSVQRDHLPTFLTAFQQENRIPVDFDIAVTTTQESILGLRSGKYDIAFCSALPFDDIECIPFLNQNLVCGVNVEHPLAQRDSVSIQDLLAYQDRLISYQPSSLVLNRLIKKALSEYGLSFRGRFANEISAASLLMVEKSSVAFMLDTTEGVSFPAVKTIAIQEFSEPFHKVAIAYHHSQTKGEAVQEFLDFSRTYAKKAKLPDATELRLWSDSDAEDCGL